MDGWIDGWMDGWMDIQRTHENVVCFEIAVNDTVIVQILQSLGNLQSDGLTNRLMGGWMDGWIDGWIME